MGGDSVYGGRYARLTFGFRGRIADRNELRFASHQASHSLELGLFFRGKEMRVFAVLIEARVIAAKVVARVSTNQMKILVEFIPDVAARRSEAFPHCESNAAMLNRCLYGRIEAE